MKRWYSLIICRACNILVERAPHCGRCGARLSIMLIVLALLSIAAPVQAHSRVYGFSVEIIHVQGQADVSSVDTRELEPFYVADTGHCGKPQIGSAYLQYVRLENGNEYMTLFSGSCAYEAWNY